MRLFPRQLNRMKLPALVLAAPLLWVLLSACGPLSQTDTIEDLETKNAQLRGTIEVFGTPAGTIAALQQAATQSVLLENQLNESRGTALASQATLTVLELTGGLGGRPVPTTPAPVAPGGNPAAGGTGSTPSNITPTPLSAPVQDTTRFTNTVMATDRDERDCPLGITSVFESTVGSMNVVTRIVNLQAGSTISAVWRANGSLFFDDAECWTPADDWSEVCAYCSIVPDGPTFPTGNWVVELLLDGELAAQTAFQVVDPQTGESATTGDGMNESATE